MRMAQGAKQGSAKKVGKENIACSHFEWCVNSIEFNFQYVFCVVFSFVHTYVCYVHEYIYRRFTTFFIIFCYQPPLPSSPNPST